MSEQGPRPGLHTERVIINRAREVGLAGSERSPSLAGDLDRLFAAHHDRILALCTRMVGDPEQARELTQEAHLVAYRSLSEFHGESRFGTWIHAIARNLCLNAIRKRSETLTEDGVIDREGDAGAMLSALCREERKALVQRASAEVLDEQEQEAVWLRYVEGLPQDDITRILDLGGTGARGLLQRCRRKLGRELRRQLDALGHGSSFLRDTRG